MEKTIISVSRIAACFGIAALVSCSGKERSLDGPSQKLSAVPMCQSSREHTASDGAPASGNLEPAYEARGLLSQDAIHYGGSLSERKKRDDTP